MRAWRTFFNCGAYSHKLDRCPKLETDQAKENVHVTMAEASGPEGYTGEWMNVCLRNKIRLSKYSAKVLDGKSLGSRFDVLKDLENETHVKDVGKVEETVAMVANTSTEDVQVPNLADKLK
ncbi:hypothetical protein LINPERPRIM_LOCUS38868 [Linum perenne]